MFSPTSAATNSPQHLGSANRFRRIDWSTIADERLEKLSRQIFSGCLFAVFVYFIALVIAADALFEVADRLPQTGADLRQLAWPEDNQRYGENDQEFLNSESEHEPSWVVAANTLSQSSATGDRA
jgi:hypothetical protein